MKSAQKLSSDVLYKFKVELHKNPSGCLVDKILTQISHDEALSTILISFHNRGVITKDNNLYSLKIDCSNFPVEAPADSHMYHLGVMYRTCLKDVESINRDWFMSNTDTPVSVKMCNSILNKSIFIRKFIKPSQCIRIIINNFETFSDDDDTDDVVNVVKPYVALSRNQEDIGNANNKQEKLCLKYLNFFDWWYDSFSNHIYYHAYTAIRPKYVVKDKKNPFKLTRDGKEKVHFKAQDKRLDVDALQQFLRPVVYMLSIPVHHKVNFKYHIFC